MNAHLRVEWSKSQKRHMAFRDVDLSNLVRRAIHHNFLDKHENTHVAYTYITVES